MPMAPATPATAPTAGLFDLALPNTERLQGVQRTAGRGRGCLGRAVDHERADGGACQGEKRLTVHSELPKFASTHRRRSGSRGRRQLAAAMGRSSVLVLD